MSIQALHMNQPISQEERVRWVTSKEYQKRRTEGACLRCGKKNHLIQKCWLRPAQKPTHVAATKGGQDDEFEEEYLLADEKLGKVRPSYEDADEGQTI